MSWHSFVTRYTQNKALNYRGHPSKNRSKNGKSHSSRRFRGESKVTHASCFCLPRAAKEVFDTPVATVAAPPPPAARRVLVGRLIAANMRLVRSFRRAPCGQGDGPAGWWRARGAWGDVGDAGELRRLVPGDLWGGERDRSVRWVRRGLSVTDWWVELLVSGIFGEWNFWWVELSVSGTFGE